MSAIKNISLYIPHVFANYSKDDIARVFNDFIGSVKTVDLVVKRGKDGKTFNAAYIHFRSDIGEQSTTATTDAGILTPVRAMNIQTTPNAPVKNMADRPSLEFTDAEIEELEAAFDANEAAIEREDQYLVSVDSRYIQTLENENMALRNSVALLGARVTGGYC